MKEKILTSGASGFVGTSVKDFLTENGYDIYVLVRRKPRSSKEIYWNPTTKEINLDMILQHNFFGVINFSGSNIAKGIRWSKKRKQKILNSRIQTTSYLVDIIKKLPSKPSVFISTSAIGIYGSPAENVTERSPAGADFLATVCSKWENSACVINSTTRVVNIRLGVVMDKSGGFLKQIISMSKLGYFILGDGNNYVSWVSLQDVDKAILFIIHNESIRGPVNVVSLNPITQKKLIHTLSQFHRKRIMVVISKRFLKIIFGNEKTQVFLLANQQVIPTVLTKSRFEWNDENIEDVLSK